MRSRLQTRLDSLSRPLLVFAMVATAGVFGLFGCGDEDAAVSVEPATLQFPVLITGDETELSINIESTGEDPLLLEPPQLVTDEDGNIEDFEITDGWSGDPLELEPGQMRQLTVRYHRQSLGDAWGAIQIGTNVVGESEIEIPISTPK